MLIISGCASDKNNRELFSDNLPHFFTEQQTGDIYIITHRYGDNFSIKLYEKESEKNDK